MTVSNQPAPGTSGAQGPGQTPGAVPPPGQHDKTNPEALQQGLTMALQLGAKLFGGHKSGDNGNSSSDSMESASKEKDIKDQQQHATEAPPDPTAAADQAVASLYQGVAAAMPPSIRGNPHLEKLFEGGFIEGKNPTPASKDVVINMTPSDREAYTEGFKASQSLTDQGGHPHSAKAVEEEAVEGLYQNMTASLPPSVRDNPEFKKTFMEGVDAGKNPSIADKMTGTTFAAMPPENGAAYLTGVAAGRAIAANVSTENARAGNPAIPSPNTQAGVIPPSGNAAAGGNRFMSNLLSVALVSVEQTMLRMDSQKSKLMSNMWVQTENMLKSIAQESAALTLQKAHTEFAQHMGQALCSAAGAVIAGAAAAKGLTSRDAATGNTWSTAISGVGQGVTGVADHLIQGVSALQIGAIDAQTQILQNIQQQLQAAASNYLDSRKQADDEKNQIMQLIMKIIDSQAALGR